MNGLERISHRSGGGPEPPSLPLQLPAELTHLHSDEPGLRDRYEYKVLIVLFHLLLILVSGSAVTADKWAVSTPVWVKVKSEIVDNVTVEDSYDSDFWCIVYFLI